ncbi:MAG TPA: hypothetical protein VH396_14410 [Chitinophagaceae bacterium]|jgi:hypothetical protein
MLKPKLLTLKNNYFGLQQKMYFYLSLILLMFFFVKGYDPASKESKNDFADSVKHDSSKFANDISSTLYTLFLKNYKDPNDPYSNQLEKLLQQRKKPHKIVLQFFKTAKDSLTLVAWSGRKKNQKFMHSEILTIWQGHDGTPLVGNVYLGDQEISKKNKYNHNSNDIRALVEVINDTANRFILFRPMLKDNTITFEVTGVKDTTPPFQKSNLKITPNPSPPRNAY